MSTTYDPRSFVKTEVPSGLMVTPMVVPSGPITLSGPTKVDIAVYHGDSGSFRVTVSDDVGDPVDLTGATWDADIRVKAADPTTVSNFDIVPVVGDPSSIDVVLSPENSELLPASCVYDVQMTVGETVKTLINGTITVTQDVSRT